MLTKGPNTAASANPDAKTKHARKSEVGDHAKYAATPPCHYRRSEGRVGPFGMCSLPLQFVRIYPFCGEMG